MVQEPRYPRRYIAVGAFDAGNQVAATKEGKPAKYNELLLFINSSSLMQIITTGYFGRY
jgi:hypothetical protein